MSIRKSLYCLLVISATLLVAGCGSRQYLVSDPTLILNYLKDSSSENLSNLSKAYGTAINRNRKKDVKQPGLFADYAVTLALQGKASEANQWFNKEIETFPSSRSYVMQLKEQLIPQYLNDNTVTSSEAAVSEEPAGDEAAAEGDGTPQGKGAKGKSKKSKAKRK